MFGVVVFLRRLRYSMQALFASGVSWQLDDIFWCCAAYFILPVCVLSFLFVLC